MINAEYEKNAKINSIANEKSDWSINLETNGCEVSFKIDTGAQCNIIPKRFLRKFDPRPKMKETSIKLSAYNGSGIPVFS